MNRISIIYEYEGENIIYTLDLGKPELQDYGQPPSLKDIRGVIIENQYGDNIHLTTDLKEENERLKKDIEYYKNMEWLE